MNSPLNRQPRGCLWDWFESPRPRRRAMAARRRPHGFTLVEVGIAATLAAVVMGGATAMLVGMMRTNSAVRERLEQISVRSHLANIFRADVASAKSCTKLDDKQPETGIRLRTDDEHSVRYVASENGVQRIAENGDKISARETFYLGDRQRVTLTMTTDVLRVVRCTIEPTVALVGPQKHLTGAKPHVPLIIAAVLGRSGRLAEAVRKATARPKAAPEPAPEAEPESEPDEEPESSKELPTP